LGGNPRYLQNPRVSRFALRVFQVTFCVRFFDTKFGQFNFPCIGPILFPQYCTVLYGELTRPHVRYRTGRREFEPHALCQHRSRVSITHTLMNVAEFERKATTTRRRRTIYACRRQCQFRIARPFEWCHIRRNRRTLHIVQCWAFILYMQKSGITLIPAAALYFSIRVIFYG